MKKILVITWFYPPVNSSEGIVTYKLLNNSKYEYDVFTQNNSALWSYSNTDHLEDRKGINCIFANANNLKEWKKEAINYFKNNKDKYDIVMTRSMPPESHEIGFKIKKIKPEIKWIASFGDPIANNPYVLLNKDNPYSVDKTSSLRTIMNPFRVLKSMIFNCKRLLKKILLDSNIEKKTINKCNLIIFNSEEQRDYMLKNKNKNNIILYHSYEEKLFPSKVEKNNDKIRMAYIGHLDKIRTPRLLFEAIKELNEENDNLSERLEIEFYGNLYKDDKVFIFDNELYNIIKYKKQITYLESLKKMKEVDYLIHIDANLGTVLDKNIFFAAKLADYIGSGTPIISITMLEGASANILRDVNGLILTYSVSDIKNYLRKIIYDNYKFEMDVDASKKYNAKKIAKQFDAIISEMSDINEKS